MDELRTNDYLKGIVSNLPESPGIYQYLNTEGTIIYVGKAKNLKRRVSSHFNREHEPGKTRVLVSKIADIRYIVVNTEEDALLLEKHPFYLLGIPFEYFLDFSDVFQILFLALLPDARSCTVLDVVFQANIELSGTYVFRREVQVACTQRVQMLDEVE